MVVMNDYLFPACPDMLQHIDVVQARFVLDFLTPCQVRPADFLGIGRSLRVAARQLPGSRDAAAARQWDALFQPALSDDPVARRKFQKPAPGFVVTIPVAQEQLFDVGDRLDLPVLFLGAGIPLILDFLRSLIQLGRQGLVAGQGCFDVTEVYSQGADQTEGLVWRQSDPLEPLPCAVQPLNWLLQKHCITRCLTVKYLTPTRLVVDGKPLRQPRFAQVFPFMLRRVTSMLYTHGGVEVLNDPAQLFALVGELEVLDAQLHWHDWRSLPGRQELMVGGFVGQMNIAGQVLEELYWVLAVASLLGIGKGASYGAGRFVLTP
jgi:hypothetical protein